jgi:hypothetical protein
MMTGSDADEIKTETSVTIWEQAHPQQDGSVVWEHNHISDGFRDDQTAPEPISAEQRRSWANTQWRKFEARVVDGRLVRT